MPDVKNDARREWTEREQLAAFRLYCATPFGRLHARNPAIIALARAMGRTPAAVAMKACNFASLDPVQQARGIAALGNASTADKALWRRFAVEADQVAAAAEDAYGRLTGAVDADVEGVATPEGITDDDEARILEWAAEHAGSSEAVARVRVRRIQSFFRAAVLAAYEGRCAITGLDVPELLTAAHIVPWNADVPRRGDPRNGICLNALHDRAFDRGLITLDSDHRVVLSSVLRRSQGAESLLAAYGGAPARLPTRFGVEEAALRYHREHVFLG